VSSGKSQGAEALRRLVAKTPLGKSYIAFRFGDIQLYVSEKVNEIDAAAASAALPSRPAVRAWPRIGFAPRAACRRAGRP
jgi:hypothetical protein